MNNLPRAKTAKGVLKWYMEKCNFRGWTSIRPTVYAMPGYEDNQRLLRHEYMHVAQILRDGRIVFMIKYTWWLMRYGYWKNPYEVEARAAADAIN